MVHRLQPDWSTPHIFRRQLYRANIPNGGKTSTGVHYDHIFLRGGPPTALTAWVPIGDSAPCQGGLMYLEDSKALGRELEDEFSKKARQGGLSDDEMRSAFNKNVSSPSPSACPRDTVPMTFDLKSGVHGVVVWTAFANHHKMMSTGMLSKDAAQFAKDVGQGRKWLIGDYQAGDAVFHHSCTSMTPTLSRC